MRAWNHTQLLPALLVPTLVLAFLAATASAGGPGFPFGTAERDNARCLSCHGDAAKVDKARFIDPQALAHTTHAKLGCTTCHDAVGTGHPDGRPVPRTTSCGDCHADVVARYAKDYHARKAPCGGCHNPHRVYAPEEISGDEMNRVCSGCHRKHAITASHSRWLPQAELHLGAITCVTCHSKAENYVITIYIVKRPGRSVTARPAPATFAELKRVAGTDTVQTLIDRNRDGYISLNELRLFNRTAAYGELSLRGMLTPVKPTHSFQTFDNRWDCTFCHASGPETMQTSFVAFPERNGTYRQVAVEKGAVLDTLHTIPNFYLTGATRNDDLDKLGLLIIAGGLVMPVGHGFLRFLTRKNRR